MANPKRRRSRRHRTSNRRTRRNPSMGRTRIKRYRHSRRRSNPGVAGFSTTELIKLAGGAAVGVVGSKYIAQIALGGSNTGAMGAAAQGVATLALAWAANKFAGKDVATGVVAGGFGAIALGLFNDYVSPGSSSVSGLGDVSMARFLGDFKPGTIAVPAGWNAPVPVPMPAAKPRSRG